MATELEVRTIGGVTYIKGDDICAGLRQRAQDYRDQMEALGPKDDLDEQAATHYVAYWSVARELDERADALAFATIAHRDEHPDDSNLE